MDRCRLSIARSAKASIVSLLVSAVYESTNEQRGNNKLVRVGYVALRRALTDLIIGNASLSNIP